MIKIQQTPISKANGTVICPAIKSFFPEHLAQAIENNGRRGTQLKLKTLEGDVAQLVAQKPGSTKSRNEQPLLIGLFGTLGKHIDDFFGKENAIQDFNKALDLI